MAEARLVTFGMRTEAACGLGNDSSCSATGMQDLFALEMLKAGEQKMGRLTRRISYGCVYRIDCAGDRETRMYTRRSCSKGDNRSGFGQRRSSVMLIVPEPGAGHNLAQQQHNQRICRARLDSCNWMRRLPQGFVAEGYLRSRRNAAAWKSPLKPSPISRPWFIQNAPLADCGNPGSAFPSMGASV